MCCCSQLYSSLSLIWAFETFPCPGTSLGEGMADDISDIKYRANELCGTRRLVIPALLNGIRKGLNILANPVATINPCLVMVNRYFVTSHRVTESYNSFWLVFGFSCPCDFLFVPKCPHLFQNVHICSKMFTLFVNFVYGLCWQGRTFYHVCFSATPWGLDEKYELRDIINLFEAQITTKFVHSICMFILWLIGQIHRVLLHKSITAWLITAIPWRNS